MNTKKVSIKDIAVKANVSIGTVDRVIHQRGEVSSDTREKVMAVIKELNYQPNLIARSLASKKKMTIAILLPDFSSEDEYWFYPQIGIRKALDEISDHGPSIHFFRFELGNKDQFIHQLKALKNIEFDGLLTAPLYPNELNEFLKGIDSGREFTLIDSSIPQLNVDFVGQDVEASGKVAGKLMQLLIGEGNEAKILIPKLVSNIQSLPIIERRIEGFKNYFNSINSDTTLHEVTLTIEPGQADIPLLRSLTDAGFTGVFVPNSRSYLVAKNVTKKLKMIGYDLIRPNIELLKNNSLDFVISQQPERQGYMAVMRIFNKIIGKVKSTGTYYLPIDILMKENVDHYVNKQMDFKSDIGY